MPRYPYPIPIYISICIPTFRSSVASFVREREQEGAEGEQGGSRKRPEEARIQEHLGVFFLVLPDRAM